MNLSVLVYLPWVSCPLPLQPLEEEEEKKIPLLNSHSHVLVPLPLLSVPAGAPSQPNVDKITKNSVDLSWNRPTNDGGSKLTGYVVEKKKKGEEWMECAHVPATSTSATVTGLVEGEEYQFRILAENAAGPGDPSKATNTITAADQPGELAFLFVFCFGSYLKFKKKNLFVPLLILFLVKENLLSNSNLQIF